MNDDTNTENKDNLTDVVEILQTQKPATLQPNQQVIASDGTVVTLGTPPMKTKDIK